MKQKHILLKNAKNYILYIVSLFVVLPLAHQSYAQSTSSEWKTQGNTADSSAFIGTTNASCLRFRSNDLERMRISEDYKLEWTVIRSGVSNTYSHILSVPGNGQAYYNIDY